MRHPCVAARSAGGVNGAGGVRCGVRGSVRGEGAGTAGPRGRPGITGPVLQGRLVTIPRCPPESFGTATFASVPPRQKPLCRAECNKAPSMYEMEGALLWPRRTEATSCPGLPGAARRPPGPDTRAIHRFPGPFSRLRSRPQMVPVSDGESISTPSASCRARVCGHSFQVSSLSTRCPQNEAAYTRFAAVIHCFCTRNPQVT